MPTPTSDDVPANIQNAIYQAVSESQKQVSDSVKLYVSESAEKVRKEAIEAAEKARKDAISYFMGISAVISFLTLLGVWGILQTSASQKLLDEIKAKTMTANGLVTSLEAANREAEDIRSRLAPLKVQQNHISDSLGGTNSVTHHVDFSSPQSAFSEPPKVMIALSYFDAIPGGSVVAIRVGVHVVKCDPKGFDYEFFSCCGTHVGEVQADWIAIGK